MTQRLGFATAAAWAAFVVSSAAPTAAHAEWVATDNDWKGCAQPNGAPVPTLAVTGGGHAIAVACGAPDRDGDYPLRESTVSNAGTTLTWASLPGAAKTVSISPEGTEWAVSADGSIYRLDPVAGGRAWTSLPGCATSIAAGADGTAWKIGCNANGPGGNDIGLWTGSEWLQVPGAAAQVAVSPDGTAWVLTVAGAIYRWTNFAFAQVPGCARALGVGRADRAWVIGCDDTPFGGRAFRYVDRGFSPVEGQMGVKIAVDQDGTPWLVDTSGKIHVFREAQIASSYVNGHLVLTGSGWASRTVHIVLNFLNFSNASGDATSTIDGRFTTKPTDFPQADFVSGGYAHAYDANAAASTTF